MKYSDERLPKNISSTSIQSTRFVHKARNHTFAQLNSNNLNLEVIPKVLEHKTSMELRRAPEKVTKTSFEEYSKTQTVSKHLIEQEPPTPITDRPLRIRNLSTSTKPSKLVHQSLDPKPSKEELYPLDNTPNFEINRNGMHRSMEHSSRATKKQTEQSTGTLNAKKASLPSLKPIMKKRIRNGGIRLFKLTTRKKQGKTIEKDGSIGQLEKWIKKVQEMYITAFCSKNMIGTINSKQSANGQRCDERAAVRDRSEQPGVAHRNTSLRLRQFTHVLDC